MLKFLNEDWKELLKEEFEKDYFKKIEDFINKEYEHKVIYPPKKDIFTAFNLTSFNNIKVVILGQDPYHNPNQAHGLSFSVKEGTKPPPSLVNIYKELDLEFGYNMPKDYGNLEYWAKQGVLLLNSILTVEKNKPESHDNIGWEIFTDNVIKLISDKSEHPVVFMLWGNYAKNKIRLIDYGKHFVLCATHPSPFSAYRGFLGCRHFKSANEFLIEQDLTPIDWKIERNYENY